MKGVAPRRCARSSRTRGRQRRRQRHVAAQPPPAPRPAAAAGRPAGRARPEPRRAAPGNRRGGAPAASGVSSGAPRRRRRPAAPASGGSGDGQPASEGGVERRQLALEHADRLAVGDDVVEGERGGRAPAPPHAEERPAPERAPGVEVEGAAGLLPRQPAALREPPGSRAAPERSASGSRQGAGAATSWRGSPSGPMSMVVRRASWRAAISSRRPREDGGRQRPVEPHRDRDVARRRPGDQPLEEPEPPLDGRQRLAPRRPAAARRSEAAAPPGGPRRQRSRPSPAPPGRRRCWPPAPRPAGGRPRAPPARAPARGRPSGNRRRGRGNRSSIPTRSRPSSSAQMPASSSSVGSRGASSLRPRRCFLPRQLALGQRLAVHLAVGGQGHRGDRQEARRDHVARAGARRGIGASSAPAGRLSPAGHEPGHQALRRPGRPPAPPPPPRAPAGARARAASISPGSMRKPRIFTWSSIRPR